MISFAKRLKELRKRNQFTMLALGNRIGVAKSTIAGYESGFREPSLTVVISLAKALDVSTDYLLGISDYPKAVDYSTLNNVMEIPKASGEFQWDGMILEEDELIEIKRVLELAIQRKEVDLRKLK